jgi:hypothetical protein
MTTEEIAKKIFYKPATNGQTDKSIKESIELIDNYVKEAKIKMLEEAIGNNLFVVRVDRLQGLISELKQEGKEKL